MESYRNRNNPLYLQNANLKMSHQNMLFLHFSLPIPQSPQMEMPHSLGPRFQWLWYDQRQPLRLSVVPCILSNYQPWCPEHYLLQTFFLSNSIPKYSRYSYISVSPLGSLTICSWTCARMSQLTSHQGPAHCWGQASLSLRPRAPQPSWYLI